MELKASRCWHELRLASRRYAAYTSTPAGTIELKNDLTDDEYFWMTSFGTCLMSLSSRLQFLYTEYSRELAGQ